MRLLIRLLQRILILTLGIVSVWLMNYRVVEAVTSYQAGEHLPVERVNHYVTDGEVTLASLRVNVT